MEKWVGSASALREVNIGVGMGRVGLAPKKGLDIARLRLEGLYHTEITPKSLFYGAGEYSCCPFFVKLAMTSCP